jgi:signal transduction histidine kinase
VSASISHELKNVLAIINENAGLLEDLTFASQRGSAIDPERLNRACQNFFKQIHRADTILKNMNRFAHSVDQFTAPVNLAELSELVASLAGRLAAMRKLTIEILPPGTPTVVDTNPFLLENMVWLCLQFAIATTGSGGTIRLIPEKGEAGTILKISGLDGLNSDFTVQMPEGHVEILAALGAKLTADIPGNELILHLD